MIELQKSSRPKAGKDNTWQTDTAADRQGKNGTTPECREQVKPNQAENKKCPRETQYDILITRLEAIERKNIEIENKTTSRQKSFE